MTVLTGVEGQPKIMGLISPLVCRIGSIIITHSFLYMPECPMPLLGRDLVNKDLDRVKSKEVKNLNREYIC